MAYTEGEWLAAIGRAAEAIGGGDFLARLAGAFATLARHDIVTVVRYARFSKPEYLLHSGAADEMSDADYRRVMTLNLEATFCLCRAAIAVMKAQGGGRIINVTAVAGKAPGAGTAPTSISRAAGIALTKALSKDHARDNILVNTVCIGLIKSAQIERAWQRESEGNPGLTLDRWYEQRGSAIPIGRVGETDEAANVIVFLASEAASYVTGLAINIDGGASAVV